MFNNDMLVPVLGAVQKYLSDAFAKVIQKQLIDKISEHYVYPIKNQYSYRMKYTPTAVSIVQDQQLSIIYKTYLYKKNQLLNYNSHNVSHKASSLNNSTFMSYSLDNSFATTVGKAFLNEKASITYKYDKSSIGKIMSTFTGGLGWDTLHEVFHLDKADRIAKPLSYSLQVSLVSDSAKLNVSDVTSVHCKAQVVLAKSTGKLSSPRTF